MSAATASSKTAPPADPKRNRRRGVKRLENGKSIHVVLGVTAFLWMIPLVMVVGLSLLPSWNPRVTAFGMFPEDPSFSNYVQIWSENPILQHILNSALITVPTVLAVVGFGSMAAFSFAKMKVPGKGIFLGTLLLALVLPISGIIVATYQILQGLGLYNNLFGLTLVYTSLGLPFAIIVIRTSFLAIPHETYEAAKLDGASNWCILWRIYLPLAKPAISVVVIWQVMMTWNDFLLPLVSINDNHLKPITLVPLAYQGTYLSQPGALFAILVLISLPVVITFVVLQKHLVNGLAGSIK